MLHSFVTDFFTQIMSILPTSSILVLVLVFLLIAYIYQRADVEKNVLNVMKADFVMLNKVHDDMLIILYDSEDTILYNVEYTEM